MIERTLFERIKNVKPEAPRQTGLDYPALVDSILTNLRYMLNTRHGSVLTCPEYGVPEFGHVVYDLPDTLTELAQAIKNTIEKYEPRLRHVRVRVREDEQEVLQLCFDVTAQLAVGSDDAVLRFQTLMDQTGQINIRD
ncbi:MAG: type VI secretion system baseplate subunit TssE [Deltaproteobacteria bacterium]|nr:type VI secretion system baseplate subunit TssE [Deltaproteobacteria bacterium]